MCVVLVGPGFYRKSVYRYSIVTTLRDIRVLYSKGGGKLFGTMLICIYMVYLFIDFGEGDRRVTRKLVNRRVFFDIVIVKIGGNGHKSLMMMMMMIIIIIIIIYCSWVCTRWQ
jgi:hypothetical protein